MTRIRFALLALAVLALPGCSLFGRTDPADYRVAATEAGYRVTVLKGPTAVIGASDEITRFEGPCRYVAVSAGPRHAVACNGPRPGRQPADPPQVVVLDTAGEIEVRTTDADSGVPRPPDPAPARASAALEEAALELGVAPFEPGWSAGAGQGR